MATVFTDDGEAVTAREYSCYSVDRLSVGDIVMVPARDTVSKAKVSAIDVPEAEIASFKDKLKIIPAGSIVGKADDNADEVLAGTDPNAWRTGEEEQRAEPPDETCATEEELRQMEREATQAVDRSRLPIIEYEDEAGWHPLGEGTAVVNVAPGKDEVVQKLLTEVMKVREVALKMVVATDEDVKMATNDLSLMSGLKKAVDEKRREYVDPINEHVKSVNDAFKLLTGPLNEADKLVRQKVVDYKQEQQRRQREAEEVNRQKEELARKEAALNYGEVTIDTTPVDVVEAQKTTRTDLGAAGMVDNWKWEVVDIDVVPREYLVPDAAMLNAIAKKHHDQKKVEGVRFYNEPTLRVSPR